MKRQMKSLIIGVGDSFPQAKLKVVFHHSVNDSYLSTHGASKRHLAGHLEFAAWLRSKNIDYIDISGAAENLKDYYSSVDLHVGYRVHAHIFMTSIGKPSLLIAEDGRGKALRGVIGGPIVDGMYGMKSGLMSRLLGRLGLKDRYKVNDFAVDDALRLVEHEMNNNYLVSKQSQTLLPYYREIMKDFIEALP